MPPVALCEDCGNVYGAEQTETGEWYLLGGKQRCQCGSTRFTIVSDGDRTVELSD